MVNFDGQDQKYNSAKGTEFLAGGISVSELSNKTSFASLEARMKIWQPL